MVKGTDLLTKHQSLSPTDLEQVLDRLSVSRRHDSLVVSCYLKLGATDRADKRYMSEIKSRLHESRATIDQLAASHEQREALKRDLGRMLEYCERPSNLPGSGGVAVFASELDDLMEVYALPHLQRFHLIIDRTPFVQPLIELTNRIGRLLSVVFDRSRARIFDVTSFGASEIDNVTSPSTRGGRYHSDRQGAPGWGEHSYHNRIETEKERHFQAISARLTELSRQMPVDGLALFGPGPSPGLLVPFLPTALSRRLVGTGSSNPKTVTPAQVHLATIELALEHARAAARETVREHADALGTGFAVNGVSATLAALFRGQARQLIVVDGVAMSGYRCRASGHLVASIDRCGDGIADPAPYLIDDTIEEALYQALPVTYVPKSDAGTIDAIAALLRFR